MDSEARPVELVLRRWKDEDETETEDAGKIAVGENGALTLVTADPEYEDYLRIVVDEVNAMEKFRVKAPPPPGGVEGGLYVDIVDRSAPDLTDALTKLFEQRFGLMAAPTAAAPGPEREARESP